ncbi:MAG: DNA internalization-related competence protein ComEC/Rec2 [Burkholderiales bacterium]
MRATGYVRTRGINHRLAASAGGFSNEINRLRETIRARMLAVLGKRPYAGVLVALVIGEQNAIPAGQWQTFWRTGTGHLMSISGPHINMVAPLVYALVFRLWGRLTRLVARVPAQRVAAVTGALSALAYSLIAGFSVPTQRTFFMLLVVALALLWRRRLAPRLILAFALFAVTLTDPWCVLAPGFWLSFGAVAMIFFVTTKRIEAAGFWRTAFMTQLAVTLGLLPLTLALFQEVSVISPFANAVAIPVVSWIVVPPSLLGALLGVLLPADFVLLLAHMVMQATYAALAWCAQLPNAVWQSHAPLPWTVALACAGVICLLTPRGLPMRWLGLAAMVPMWMALPPQPKPGEVWVTLLDVGQGLAMVVRTAYHALVYDAGPRWNPDADSGNRIVVPYLRGEGVRQLDALIISHDDEDHSGGARSIIAARRPNWLLTSALLDKPDYADVPEKMRCEHGDG